MIKIKDTLNNFFELIDEIMEFRNIPLPLLQHIINVVLNTNINLQTLEFWIKIKNKFSRNKEYLRSKTLSTLDKMTIANQTSQIFQIYRELSLYDTYKILNELKDIENQLLKPIKKKNTKHHNRKQHKQNNNTPLILRNTKNKQRSRTTLQKLFTKIKEKQKKNH